MRQFAKHGLIWRGEGIFTVLCAALILSCPNCYNPGDTNEANCLARAHFGDPAQSLYTLPYPVGSTYAIFQAYCSSGSHSNQLAYDFRMNVGTPLVSAREGVVAEIVDTYEDTDTANHHFNYIMIRHDDNTAAFYAHLKHGCIAVHLNDRVERGQPIALSGTTGSPIPHLHFGVYRTWPAREGDDVPVNFRNAQGPLDERGGLQAGYAYLALPY